MNEVTKKEQNVGLFLAYLVGFSFSCNYTNHAPLKDILIGIKEYGFDNAKFGFLATSMFLTHAIMQIPGGHMADQFGARRVVAVALLWVGLGNLGIIFSDSYYEFIICKFLIGVGTGTSFIAGARYISQLIPAQRLAKTQAYYGASILLGSGFVIFVVPILAKHPLLGLSNWQSPFVATASLALLVAMTWLRLAPRPCLMPHTETKMSDLLLHGQLWLLGIVQMASFGLVMVIGNWITALLKQQVGDSSLSSSMIQHLKSSPQLLGALASMVILLGVVGRPLGGYLVEKLGVRWILSVSFLFNTVGCFVLAQGGISIAWIMLSIVLLGFGCALPYASLFNRATILFPSRAGAAKGLVNMLGVVMILVGAPLLGYIKDSTGNFSAGFMTLGIMSFTVWIISFQIKN